MITVILCIRHARKGSDGNLTEEGRQTATEMGERLHKIGLTQAIVAPNFRCEQTAESAGLTIVGRDSDLAIPEEYEEYLNGPVVKRMLAQPGKPWEQSYTKAVLEDFAYSSMFGMWGSCLARFVRDLARIEQSLVLIGSSPRIELAYLALIGSNDWNDFPRCRELQGFYFDEKYATKFE